MIEGFMFVGREEGGAIATARPGALIRNPTRANPWLVVDHVLDGVIVTRWPGRLWRVAVIDPLTNAEMRALRQELLPDARYTRAIAVKVLEELPVASLFGPHGEKICAVIDTAAALTLEQAARLAAARHSDAPNAQTRAWCRYLGRTADTLDVTMDGTLSVSDGRSPLGLSVIHGAVGRRAIAVAGDGVWISRPNDDEDVVLAEPWLTASMSLLDAAWAFGAPDLHDADDRAILAKGWRDVIGPDP